MNSGEPRQPLSVLVIDDEPQIQRLLTITLEANGYRVATANDGQEGLAAAAQRRHDVILLDLGLPDLNGVVVLKRIPRLDQDADRGADRPG